MNDRHFVYLAECSDGTLYTGYTTDPERRQVEHNRGKGAKYTRGRRPVRFVYLEEAASRSEAQKREAEIKAMSREEKIGLAGGNGILFLCATPIGNLEDISLRCLRVLREADLIAAEDTRRFRKLASHFEISAPVVSYYEHNAHIRGPEIVQRIREGASVALVTDAGLPGVSDPGEHLVRLVLEADLKVVPIPGPSASLTALVASGAATGRFVFEGFLPREKSGRRERIETIAREPRTVILYEAPHRVVKTLQDLAGVIGERPVVCARELTKVFEEFRRGSAAELAGHYGEHGAKGEFTLIIDAAEGLSGGTEAAPDPLAEAMVADPGGTVLVMVDSGWPEKEAIRRTAVATGKSRREIYREVVAAKSNKQK